VPTDRVIPPQESQKIYPQGNEDARPYATLMVSGTEVSASIDKVESVVYATDDTGVFDPRAVFPCGLLSPGVATGSFRYDGTEHYLELSSLAEQGCLSFGMLSLPHNIAYIAAVTYKHETGRPLLLAFINQSAKHTEIETYLTRNTDWTTDYFILPPLSPDGLGYTVYLANDAKGRYKTVNDIKSIRVYRFPYNELVRLRFPPKIQDVSNIIKPEQFLSAFSVYHPNTSYYRITIDNPFDQAKTLVLNQSYHTGWRAYEIETCDKGQVTRNSFILSPISCLLSPYVPFLFGHELKEHVLVNNWANGWILPEQTTDNKQLTTIVIFFLPQLLEWIGFALLLLTVPILLLYGRTRAGRIKA
jgi:hypothetical protein